MVKSTGRAAARGSLQGFRRERPVEARSEVGIALCLCDDFTKHGFESPNARHA